MKDDMYDGQSGCPAFYSGVVRPELNKAETSKTCETSATV